MRLTIVSEALLFALSESRDLAVAVSAQCRLPLAPLEERSFEQDEFKLRPLCSVRGRRLYVLQSLAHSPQAPTAQRLVRLLFLLAALRDGGAAHVTAVVPYLAYARKDRRTQTRDPVHTRYVAQLLEAVGLPHLIALDVHNPAALDNAFRIHVDHLSALPMMVAHFAGRLGGGEQPLVVSPDVGGIKRVQIFRELLERRLGRPVEQAFIDKRRVGGQVSGGTVVGGVAGRAAIVLDDLCASGGTLQRAAASLREAGAAAVHAVVTHAPQPSGILALLDDPRLSSVTVTDSVGWPLPPPPAGRVSLEVLPVAPLLGSAISHIERGQPLAVLLDQWPGD